MIEEILENNKADTTLQATPAEGESLPQYPAEPEAPSLAQITQDLLAQAETLSQSYPGFNLEQALEKEDFAELMLQGLSMEQAYALSHAEEIFQSRLHLEKQKWEAAQKAMEQRVPEAALQKTSYPSPDSMSRAQREAIARRVERGEIITL